MFLSGAGLIKKPVFIQYKNKRRDADHCNNKGRDKANEGKLIVSKIKADLKQRWQRSHFGIPVFGGSIR